MTPLFHSAMWSHGGVSPGELPGHPRFFDEQSGSAVGAIDYVRGSGNRLLTSIPL